MTDMRDRHQRWLSWRVAPVVRPDHPAGRPDLPAGGRFGGAELALLKNTVKHPKPTPESLAELKADTPGPDGVRRRLVERVRQLIAEGAYDTPERWDAAEDRFFRRVTDDS
jgi:hypothetical protein